MDKRTASDYGPQPNTCAAPVRNIKRLFPKSKLNLIHRASFGARLVAGQKPMSVSRTGFAVSGDPFLAHPQQERRINKRWHKADRHNCDYESEKFLGTT